MESNKEILINKLKTILEKNKINEENLSPEDLFTFCTHF